MNKQKKRFRKVVKWDIAFSIKFNTLATVFTMFLVGLALGKMDTSGDDSLLILMAFLILLVVFLSIIATHEDKETYYEEI
jgi:hypothetical protein